MYYDNEIAQHYNSQFAIQVTMSCVSAEHINIMLWKIGPTIKLLNEHINVKFMLVDPHYIDL